MTALVVPLVRPPLLRCNAAGLRNFCEQSMLFWGSRKEDFPQFLPAQDRPLEELPTWIQELWPLWQQSARPGPGAVEFFAHVETWYTDHGRVQQCLSSRIVTLGADPTAWVAEIMHEWRDYMLAGVDTRIVAVDPATDDRAPNVFARLMLIQRPGRFQRSIVVTISDMAVELGLPHSCAIVASDHVRLHGVLLMTNLLYQCPPGLVNNRCRLFYGTRELRGEAYIPATHGDVFNLIIQRYVTVDIQELLALPDEHLRQRLYLLLSLIREFRSYKFQAPIVHRSWRPTGSIALN